MPDEDNHFGGSLVLDFRKCHVQHKNTIQYNTMQYNDTPLMGLFRYAGYVIMPRSEYFRSLSVTSFSSMASPFIYHSILEIVFK